MPVGAPELCPRKAVVVGKRGTGGAGAASPVPQLRAEGQGTCGFLGLRAEERRSPWRGLQRSLKPYSSPPWSSMGWRGCRRCWAPPAWAGCRWLDLEGERAESV